MNDEDETPTPRAGSSRQASNSHGLHITLSPTIDSPQEATRHEIESFPPLSTSAADALRSAYFSASDSHSSAGLRRSLSNPDISGFLSTDLSHGSRLADVSETDTVENFSDLNRSRTQPRGKSRRKRKVDRTGSARIMSLGEEEVPQDWTVFGELFEDNHAPIVGKKSSQRGRTRSNTVANASETTNATVARNATSVIRHWRSIITASRPPRNDEELQAALNGGTSSSRAIDILSRGKTVKKPPANVGVGSPTAMLPPEEDRSSISPLRRVFDGDEDNLAHHRQSADYERSIRAPAPRRRSKSIESPSSGTSDTSSDSDDPQTPTPASQNKPMSIFKKLRDEIPTLSTLQRNMLKCAIAYFLASLFTFVPFLSNLIADIVSFGKGSEGPSPTTHMIATVSVYYNPAKTTGGMFEADIFCLMGVLFATFVTCGSILSSWIIENEPSIEWLGESLMFVWIAAAMTTISWMKVWINKASFATASSMTCIILFIVVVKEGGFEMLGQVVINVVIGATIANIVCFVLWPQSATINLQRDMITSLESYATLLDMLSSSFLLDPRSKGRNQLVRAVEAHQAGFTSLKRNLDEARSEWVLDPPDAPGRRGFRQQSMSNLYGEAVDSLNRLAQHLAGLRSGTKLQRDLTLSYGKKKMHEKLKKENRRKAAADGADVPAQVDNPKEMDEDEAALSAAALVFGSLVEDIGPPMVALTNACTGTLKSMRKALIQDRQRARSSVFWRSSAIPDNEHDFSDFSASIERALFTFDSTSNHALMRLYRRSAYTETSSIASTSDGLYDENETMFLVYFFIFTLQEFARELVSLVDIMGQLHEAQEDALAYRGMFGWFRRTFTVRRRGTASTARAPDYGATMNGTTPKRGLRPAFKRHFSNLVPLEPSNSPRAAFPKVRAHVPNTTQTPARSSLSFFGRVQHRLWSSLHKLKDGDMRYSFKVGVGTAILALPAFIDATRPTFVRWKGEWALISYFVVMGQTLGQTNFLSLHRIGGTICGAGVAVGAFVSFSHYPVLLAIFGFFFSLPCFYYIVSKPEYATTGRFVLLSYNLTALYCYNSRSQNTSVYDVALHRSIAVTAGVLWALLVSRVWWPSEARRELGVGLSDFLLNVGWLYNRLVMTYSVPPEALSQVGDQQMGISSPIIGSPAALVGDIPGGSDERTGLLSAALTTGINTNIRDFMSMELHLQIKLISLQKLLSQAVHEPRLKGPFPVQLYRSILTSLQMILDLFHSMRCVTTREEWYTNVRRDFVIPVNKERREMVGNVILYFSVLSSAFQLKKPLPPYLPPAERSRQGLVERLKELPIVKERKVQSSRQLLYFAYALMMKGVIAEMETLGKAAQDAFGVIGQNTEEFESLFLDYTAIDRAREERLG